MKHPTPRPAQDFEHYTAQDLNELYAMDQDARYGEVALPISGDATSTDPRRLP